MRITADQYDEFVNELESRKSELNEQWKMLTENDTSFHVTTSYLLDLAQRAEQLFQNSGPELRQKLLEFLLSNIELNDKRLSCNLNDPFKTIVEVKKEDPSRSNSEIWCA